MLNKNQLSKIGIGTWGIGGLMEADPKNDESKRVNSL